MLKRTYKIIITGVLLVTITLTSSGCVVTNLTVSDVPRWIEYAIEKIEHVLVINVKETLKTTLINKLNALILGETTGQAGFITDWEEFLRDAPKRAAGEFLDDFFSVTPPKWANPRVETILRSTLTGEGVSLECPLSQFIDDLDDVFDPAKGGGWDLFLLALDPRCNDAGRYLMAQGGMMATFTQKSYEQAIRGIVGQGYSDMIRCEEWNCWKHEAGFVTLWHPGKCSDQEQAAGGTDECVKEKIVVPGSLVAATDEEKEIADLRKILESDLDDIEDIVELMWAYSRLLMNRIFREAASKIMQ